MATKGIDVRVENQLVRFISRAPVDQDAVVAQLGGTATGGVVIKVLDAPRATIVIDTDGKIVVHGTQRIETARAAAKEFLLQMGLDDSGLITELGPMVASFNFEETIAVESIVGVVGAGDAQYDARLGCTVVVDSRHDITLNIWPNGRCIALGAHSPNMVAMAAVYWKSKFAEKGYFIQRV